MELTYNFYSYRIKMDRLELTNPDELSRDKELERDKVRIDSLLERVMSIFEPLPSFVNKDAFKAFMRDEITARYKLEREERKGSAEKAIEIDLSMLEYDVDLGRGNRDWSFTLNEEEYWEKSSRFTSRLRYVSERDTNPA